MSKMMTRNETAVEHEIAARLIAELLRKEELDYDHIIGDESSDEKYRVTIRRIKKADIPEKLPEHRTFIVVGPAGDICRCCQGSGREPD